MSVRTAVSVWDLETSGLDPFADRILEIGCKVIHADGREENRKWVLDHGIPISEEITRITGIDAVLIAAEGRDPRTCLIEFVEVLQLYGRECQVTHNGMRFDIAFLAAEAGRYGVAIAKDLAGWLRDRVVDTAALYKARCLGLIPRTGESHADFATRVRGLRYNVAHVCEQLGIATEGVTMHRALGDVELTTMIWRALVNPEAPNDGVRG